ncbi:hypothetical protein ACWCXC_15515 [Streptomyces sp. NPDC001515]
MKQMILPALAAVVLVLAGCSSEDSAEPPSEAPSAAQTFNETDTRREAWETTRDSYTATLRLDICKAAKTGGKASVEAYLKGDELPFEVDDPDYDADQWVTYCEGQ